MGLSSVTERVILSDVCVAEGYDWLCARVPAFDRLCLDDPIPLRLRNDGFPALLSAIVGQQVSVASARALWAKLDAAHMTNETAIKSASEDRLRALGLSRQKARYARNLALAEIDFDGLRSQPSEAVIGRLVQITGIGRWTAEIYVMFSLGRADVIAAGDLALQEAARQLFNLPARPSERDLRAMAEDWSPWRSVAARILWAYYSQQKNREGLA